MALLDPVVVTTPTAPGVRRGRLVRYLKNLDTLEMIALVWLVLLVLAAVLAPLLPLKDPLRQDFKRLAESPSMAHPLGTDANGRDLLARSIYGARISLLIGVTSVFGGMVIGGGVGIIAGYVRGTFDKLTSILVDALLSIPGIVLLMAMTAALGRSLPTLIVGLTILTIAPMVRLARSQSMVSSQQTYVTAARVIGVRRRRILWVDIVPNAVPTLAAYAVLLFALVIVAEGSLSFLGIGVPPPSPSWGAMIAAGRDDLETSPMIALVPSAAMVISVLAIYVLGERIQRSLNARDSVI
jgi:peptide/nickel transport system permease protein